MSGLGRVASVPSQMWSGAMRSACCAVLGHNCTVKITTGLFQIPDSVCLFHELFRLGFPVCCIHGLIRAVLRLDGIVQQL